MLDKAADWVRADPWRVAALGLAAALLVALAMLLTGPEGTAAAPGPDEASSPTSTSPSTATSVGGTVADQAETGEGDEEPSSPASAGGGFLAVKIDNAPGARPQVGIGTAPLLVEVLVEGGLTRFVAVFPQGASGVVGPIRSLRPVDADLIPAVAVNIVSTGGQPFVIQAVQASGIQRIEPGFFDEFESGRRDPPHDTFLDLDVLMPLISGSQSDADGLPIGELPQVAGAATVIDIPFGSVEYRYEAGRYLRYENGEAFEVLETPDGELLPLAHDTLVVMTVAERPAGYFDSNDIPVSTFDVIGGGELLVFYGGEVFEGSWLRSAQQDPYSFLDSNGRQVGIPSGSTYLALVPRGSQVTFGP